MYREEAVKLMCDTVDEYNREQARHNNMDLAAIEDYIASQRQQMEFVNGMLYDTLKSNGVIH
jgi:hypothetical protein